jgi:hypothetical protein
LEFGLARASAFNGKDEAGASKQLVVGPQLAEAKGEAGARLVRVVALPVCLCEPFAAVNLVDQNDLPVGVVAPALSDPDGASHARRAQRLGVHRPGISQGEIPSARTIRVAHSTVMVFWRCGPPLRRGGIAEMPSARRRR